MKYIILAAIAAFLSACAIGSKTVLVSGLDDPMETTVWVSSAEYERPPLTQNGDAWLRAAINKTNNKVMVYQLVYFTKEDSDKPFTRARYSVDNSSNLVALNNHTTLGEPNVVCSGAFGCFTQWTGAFTLNANQINQIASGNSTQLRFESPSMQFDVVVSGAEAADFMAQTTGVTQKLGN